MGPALTQALKATSRSFWLSLRFLPPATRSPIAVAYALARLADTIVDTDCVDLQQRLGLLEAFQRRLVHQNSPETFELGKIVKYDHISEGEKKLLDLAHAAFSALDRLSPRDARLTREVLQTLTEGMVQDAILFSHPHDGVAALRTMEQLDQYCYMVAGCVGKYWTEIHETHLVTMKGMGASLGPLGIRLGKGLQMINILRDLPEDLRNGRCYLPEQDLGQLGLAPGDLLDPNNEKRLIPLLHYLRGVCLEHLRAGREYLRRLPKREIRLRLCTTWPLEIAIKTLEEMDRNPHPLDPKHRVKIPRRAVYVIVFRSFLFAANRSKHD